MNDKLTIKERETLTRYLMDKQDQKIAALQAVVVAADALFEWYGFESSTTPEAEAYRTARKKL